MAIVYIRDNIIVDPTLLNTLIAQDPTSDSVIFIARNCTAGSLSGFVNYTIAADEFVSQGSLSAPSLQFGTPASITLLAKTISGSLQVTCSGAEGPAGAEGAPGDPGTADDNNGNQGGVGGTGGQGGPGGSVTVYFGTAASAPNGFAPGGAGGPGGPGGPGGAPFKGRGGIFGHGRPGPVGRKGSPGPQGSDGSVIVVQVDNDEVWGSLDPTQYPPWAAYRVLVGQYLFRQYTPASMLAAITEFQTALQLDPTNTAASILLKRLVQQQTPSGLPRDLDIVLDFSLLIASVQPLIQNLLSAYQTYQTSADTQTLLNALLQFLQLTILKLKDQLTQASTFGVPEAQAGLTAAQQQSNLLQSQIATLKQQLASSSNPFSFGAILSTVGIVAGVVAGMSTGAGAIVSIAAAIAAVGTDAADAQSQYLDAGGDASDPSSIGGGLDTLLSKGKSLINLGKMLSQVTGGDTTGGQLSQLAELTKEGMIANLRQEQAQEQLDAANLLVTQLTNEVNNAQNLEENWAAEVKDLNALTEQILHCYGILADRVTNDVFQSFRALEVYQVQPINVRFDYGHIHPDTDKSLYGYPADRASAYGAALASLPNDVASAVDIYNQLNTGEITGFDVVHPLVPVSITDVVSIEQFSKGGSLEFSLTDATGLPIDVFEMKVVGVDLELLGASSANPVNVWISHSGHWVMVRHTDKKTVEFNLLPRDEAVGCSASAAGLRGSIPANTTQAPPFSFWGRGVMAKWRLYIDDSTVIDTSTLTAINITFSVSGYKLQSAAGLQGLL